MPANVADLTFAVEWSTEVFGFEVGASWPLDQPNHAHFATGGGATFDDVEADDRGGRFNFNVDDSNSLWQRLEDVGVVIELVFNTPHGAREFTVADPDGNELGLVRDK